MKRNAFLLVFILIFSSFINFSLAEEFTIHAGTKFGDTREEVMAKETLLYCGENGKDGISFRGTVAGFDNSKVYYNFDDNVKLIEVYYGFNSYDGSRSSRTIQNIYETLLDGLTQKYGNEITDKDYIKYGIPSWALNICNTSPTESRRIYDLNVWIVPCDGYNVKIELIRTMDRDCFLSYLPYTDEMAKDAEKLYRDKQNKINDDL